MAKKRNGICGLCGAHTEVTREHFVPQCLWPRALPNRTETIPACNQCNAGSNLDDEYFRNTLVMMPDLTHPKKQELFAGPVLRSLKNHPGWIKYALANTKVRPMFSPSGLWLGDFPVLPLDMERFRGSLFKIVKGLFFLIRKSPFPADGRILVVGQMNAQTMPLIRSIEKHLCPPTFDFGDDVFEWRFGQTKDGITMWMLAFYRSIVFYACGYETDELTEKEIVPNQALEV
jgi:hypothetical protein